MQGEITSTAALLNALHKNRKNEVGMKSETGLPPVLPMAATRQAQQSFLQPAKVLPAKAFSYFYLTQT